MARAIREVPWLETRDGVYNVHWYDPGAKRTKRLSLRTKDANVASHRYSAFLSEGRDILSGAVANAHLAVDTALDQYRREHVALKCADKARQETAIFYLKAFFGNAPIKDIDRAACRAYATERERDTLGRPGSPATIVRELVVLRAAANHARKEKRITLAEMPVFDMPEVAVESGEPPWHPKDDIDLLIQVATGSLRDFIVLAYWTASRRNAIETLTVSQVNLPGGFIALAKPGERITKKRRPKVPIFPAMREPLERLVAQAKAEGRDVLFPKNMDIYKRFSRLCTTLGFQHVHPHTLRHSRATHMLMDGVSIYQVAKQLGDTIATVERVYGHCSIEFLAKGGGE